MIKQGMSNRKRNKRKTETNEKINLPLLSINTTSKRVIGSSILATVQPCE
jgi:hypothetical protein